MNLAALKALRALAAITIILGFVVLYRGQVAAGFLTEILGIVCFEFWQNRIITRATATDDAGVGS